jgi:hypothetical protein
MHRALEYLEVALAAEPGSVYTLFVKVKALLMRRDAARASAELDRLLACEEFRLDLLRVRAALVFSFYSESPP